MDLWQRIVAGSKHSIVKPVTTAAMALLHHVVAS
jgi:hypothetical protein